MVAFTLDQEKETSRVVNMFCKTLKVVTHAQEVEWGKVNNFHCECKLYTCILYTLFQLSLYSTESPPISINVDLYID